MSEPALLLVSQDSEREARRVARVLQFFGIRSRALAAGDFAVADGANPSQPDKVRIVCSATGFLEAAAAWKENPDWKYAWARSVHSVFIHLADDADANRNLAQMLSAAQSLEIRELAGRALDLVVSDRMTDFCGPLSGIRTTAKGAARTNLMLTVGSSGDNIISAPGGAIFLKVEYQGVPVFLSTSREIIDLDAELESQNFDVRQYFPMAVPLVLYIKWAFAHSCWTSPETNACLVIDDPVLKPRHGFVDFRELLGLMKRYDFTTNIAFIPWNWRRSSPEVVRFFKENPRNYSLSVHGCDHVRAEFGGSDRQHLYFKARQALERIRRHEAITGIRHDRVMVFPQGIFSEAAIDAIKRTDLIAAVNNDILLREPHHRAITLADMWTVAVMNYSAFAIFTRRYPWEGIENFAFDALLGKPAIAVIHHDYCSDHCARLIAFVERLNALKSKVIWRNLVDVVSRSYRLRQLTLDTTEVEMYAAMLQLENFSGGRKRVLITRRESEPSAIREISDGFRLIPWMVQDGCIKFEIEVAAGERKSIHVKFHELGKDRQKQDTIAYLCQAMLRRYLCEIRDNYVTTTRMRLAQLLR